MNWLAGICACETSRCSASIAASRAASARGTMALSPIEPGSCCSAKLWRSRSANWRGVSGGLCERARRERRVLRARRVLELRLGELAVLLELRNGDDQLREALVVDGQVPLCR